MDKKLLEAEALTTVSTTRTLDLDPILSNSLISEENRSISF